MVYIYFLVSILSLAAAQSAAPKCIANVSVNSTQPSHAAFLYHDIFVQNGGSCPITKVFVSITLPPMLEVFDYQNVSDTTGELYGLSNPELPGSTELGGTIVLQSIRTPLITLESVECEASCMGIASTTTPSIETPTATPTATPTSSATPTATPTSSATPTAPATPTATPTSSATPTPSATVATPSRVAQIRSLLVSPPPPVTTKVEIEWGSNSRWLALSLIDDIDTSDVWIVDAKNSRQLMKRENWNSKVSFTFSPDLHALELPLSVELKTKDGESVLLKDFITSFSYAVLDTQVAFPNAPAVPADYSLRLVAHPTSNSHWVGLTPYGTEANQVTGISIKASNTDYAPMNMESQGFFAVSSPNLALRLPISARVSFADGSVLSLDNVVDF